MKYFYQQLFGFLSVVLVTIVACGILFYNVMSNNIYTQRSQQLQSYAKGIIASEMSYADIKKIGTALKEENVTIAIFDEKNNMTFPSKHPASENSLSEEELNHLKNGSAINLKEVQTDFSGDPVENLLTVYYPIIKEKQYKGYVALASPISRIQTEVRELRNSMFIAFGAAGIIGMLMSFIFANYQNRRINKLRQATHKISEGDFDVKLKVDSQDEFDELMLDFNSMARSLREMEKEVERQENVRRQFMMDVAHEMRTPLTTMNGLLDGLKYNMVPESRRGRSLELISSETQRLIRLVNENLDYEKIRSNQIVLVQHRFAGLGAIRAVVEQMQALTKVKNNEISYECDPEFSVYADYDRFVQILVNITKNANQFTDDGKIVVKAWNDGKKAIVEISDTGIGIDKREINEIWERFYKADISRKSTKYGESGLGLAIVKSLVDSHRGRISVRSEIGQGTTFRVVFPGEPELS
ncbi:sensor histidine kinase [Granulicatella adiacens]|uniref:sensor histidine kinase n=1 Tax=Granulicatella adiacens TaxID=46124 RepID=UPI0021A28623|nr:HAMP domain-containing sensor histidine kinase [Granulicatella adiacens]MCT2161397.1 HAMP domain-containing histidine kinase [Granulicatella adiacens]